MIWMIVLTFIGFTGGSYQVWVPNTPAPPYTTRAECTAFLPALNADLATLYPDEQANVKAIHATCEKRTEPR